MRDKPPALISVRAFVILHGALMTGALAGGLTYLATGSVPESILYAAGVFSGSLLLLHRIIDAARPLPRRGLAAVRRAPAPRTAEARRCP